MAIKKKKTQEKKKRGRPLLYDKPITEIPELLREKKRVQDKRRAETQETVFFRCSPELKEQFNDCKEKLGLTGAELLKKGLDLIEKSEAKVKR